MKSTSPAARLKTLRPNSGVIVCALIAASLFLTACATAPTSQSAEVSNVPAVDPLPSWNDGATRERLMGFVARVSDSGGPDFVPEAERIAVFDNDGTLWGEQPLYFQLIFAMDRIRAMADDHPEWASTQPYQAVLENDLATLIEGGHHAIAEILMASHANMSSAEFATVVRAWLDEARHPRFDRPYNELLYQPMLELLSYLRANGFTTYIVSGGGIEFMRVFAEEAYGIPPQQVIGSSIVTRYEVRDGVPVIMRQPEVDFIDDKDGKPVAINKFIGRRPIAAFGNSDGDFQMLEWTTSGEGPRLGVLVHHTDGEREWAYDRDSSIGRLVRGLDEAEQRGWLLIDMAEDWGTVFGN